MNRMTPNDWAYYYSSTFMVLWTCVETILIVFPLSSFPLRMVLLTARETSFRIEVQLVAANVGDSLHAHESFSVRATRCTRKPTTNQIMSKTIRVSNTPHNNKPSVCVFLVVDDGMLLRCRVGVKSSQTRQRTTRKLISKNTVQDGTRTVFRLSTVK